MIEPSSLPEPSYDEPAIVLTGGGARAAYQVGVLRTLGRHFPELRFPIITGISAGAINAVYLAAHPEGLGEASRQLRDTWVAIEVDDVFRVDWACLLRNVVRWGLRLVLGDSALKPQIKGLVETEPLRGLLRRTLGVGEGAIDGISRNLAAGHLRAVALATVDYGTGQTVQWVEGRDVANWRRPTRHSRSARLTVEHIMASASLPLLFPAVGLEGSWYGDGGIRMSAPLSPALHLGAGRVLAISTRYDRSQDEADTPYGRDYPSPAQIAGNLMNAVFLDLLDQDVMRLERLNKLLRKLPPEEREGLRDIDLFVLRPSQDLGRLAARYEAKLPKGFRFLTRGLGTRDTESPDFLSLLMFQSDYIDHLIALGEEDAEARVDELVAFLQ